MPWIKPFSFHKNKDLNNDIMCPWSNSCPSWNITDKVGVRHKREKPLPQKLKLIETPQPFVRLYECGYCGFRFLYSADGQRIREEDRSHLKNPALIGGHKGVSICR